MLYTTSLTIPANTAKNNKVCTEISIREGVITKISIVIPWGHFGLAHLIILDGTTQIIPFNPDSSIVGNDETFTFDVNIDVKEPEHVFKICGWNEDIQYSHTFYVRFIVMPHDIANPMSKMFNLLYTVFKRMRMLPRGWRLE